MEVSGQLHAPVALTPGKVPPAPREQEIGCNKYICKKIYNDMAYIHVDKTVFSKNGVE
jgi:hypothetical protein